MSELYESARTAFERSESLHVLALSLCTTLLGVVFLLLLLFDQAVAAH